MSSLFRDRADVAGDKCTDGNLDSLCFSSLGTDQSTIRVSPEEKSYVQIYNRLSKENFQRWLDPFEARIGPTPGAHDTASGAILCGARQRRPENSGAGPHTVSATGRRAGSMLPSFCPVLSVRQHCVAAYAYAKPSPPPPLPPPQPPSPPSPPSPPAPPPSLPARHLRLHLRYHLHLYHQLPGSPSASRPTTHACASTQ